MTDWLILLANKPFAEAKVADQTAPLGIAHTIHLHTHG